MTSVTCKKNVCCWRLRWPVPIVSENRSKISQDSARQDLVDFLFNLLVLVHNLDYIA